MYKGNLYQYKQSSEQDDSANEEPGSQLLTKQTVIHHHKPLINKTSDEVNKNQPDEEDALLRPKLKFENKKTEQAQNKSYKLIQNTSMLRKVKNHSISQKNLQKKAVNAAYTFKLKASNSIKKRNDPVSLFHETKTSWKKDKFLTSRLDLKQGRKLQLQKRTKQYE